MRCYRRKYQDAVEQKEKERVCEKGRPRLCKKLLEVIEDIAMVNAIEEGAKTGLASREQVFKILRGQE